MTLLQRVAATAARVGLAAAFVVGGLAIAPQAAGADDVGTAEVKCLVGLCSRTHNQSSFSAFVARDWGTGGPKAGSQTDWLSPGESTPWDEDWDGFRVDGGWCYRGVIETWVYVNGTLVKIPSGFTYDRRGLGELWVQVHDNQAAIITRQGNTSC